MEEKKKEEIKQEEVKKEEIKITKERKKIKFPSLGKYKFVFLGVFLIVLFTLSVVILSGYFAIKYSQPIQEYIAKLISNENITIEEKSVVITNEESAVIEIVENASPSVVSIAVSKLTLSQDQGLVDQSSNIGTGFIVGEDGVIITNQHVVSDLESEYKVVTQDGKEYEVEEVLRDDLNDIALIKISIGEDELKGLTLGDSDNLLVGQSVIAIGTPLGQYAGSVTTGIISGLDRSVTASSGWFGSTAKTYEDVIQTDAAVNPGNSGGPLLNSQGEVVGINFATTSGADNISFAIPINKIKGRIDEYRTYGKFIRPYLGVTYQMISEYEALYYSDVVAGALVLRVDPTSPAFKGDIKRGDIITEFAGEEVTKSLGEIIQQHDVDEEIEIKVYRDSKEETVKVILGEMD
jgi:S1-C subfamily serine protease